MEASVLDLRKNMSAVLSAINRHERVTLTHRGHRKAVIVPLTEKQGKKVKVSDLAAFGMWQNRKETEDVTAYVENLRKGRTF